MAFGRAYSFDKQSLTAGTRGFAATVSTGNTVAVSSAAARTGASGVRITRTDAAGTVYFGTGNSSLPPTLLNAQMWYGVAVRFQALPSADTILFRMGSNTHGYILVDSSGNVTSQIQGGTASPSAGTLTTGVWYWLEWLHDVSGTTHTIKVRVDGGTDQLSSRSGLTASTSRINIIGTDIAGGGTYTMDVDDLVIHSGTTTFQGKKKVINLVPNTDGNSVWSITGGSATRWEAVDDATPDDATSYISSTTASAFQLLGFDTYTLGAGETFDGVSVYGRVGSNGTSGTRTVAANLRNGATDGTASTWSAAINGWQDSSIARDYADCPGSTGWSQSEIDGIVLRLVKDATTSQVRVTTTSLDVAVSEPFVTNVDKSASDSATLSESSLIRPGFGMGDPIFIENFNRADQALEADDDWEGAVFGGGSSLSIVSNQLKSVGVTGNGNTTTRTNFGNGDYGFTFVNVPDAEENFHLYYLYQNNTNTLVTYFGHTGSGHWVETYQVISNDYVLKAGTYAQSWSDGDKVGVRKDGTSFTVYRVSGGTESVIQTFTDATYSTGAMGVHTEDPAIIIDDLFHTALTSGANLSPADTDIFTLSESSSLSISLPVSGTDSAALTEASSLSNESTRTDSAALSEARSIGIEGTRTDSASLTEAASNAVVTTGSDSSTLSEAYALGAASDKVDSATLSEQSSFTSEGDTTDTGTLDEDSSIGVGLSGTEDVFTLSESSSIDINIFIESLDGWSVSDFSVVAADPTGVELLAVVDEVTTLEIVSTHTDDITLTDVVSSIETDHDISDDATLQESAAIAIDITSTDDFSFTDNAIISTDNDKNGVDVAGLSEDSSLIVGFSSSDEFSLVESAELEVPHELEDIITTSEDSTIDVELQGLDEATLSETSLIEVELVSVDEVAALTESYELSINIDVSDTSILTESPNIDSELTLTDLIALIEDSNLDAGQEGLAVMLKIGGTFVQGHKKRKINGIFS